MTPAPAGTAMLLVSAGPHACALPLPCVVETMRPLPLKAISGMPPAVLGLSIIRGEAVPVVSLAALLGAADPGAARFVTMRVPGRGAERRVALAVTAVLGVRELPTSALRQLPPLLRDEGAAPVRNIALRDRELWLVLAAARVLPEVAT